MRVHQTSKYVANIRSLRLPTGEDERGGREGGRGGYTWTAVRCLSLSLTTEHKLHRQRHALSRPPALSLSLPPFCSEPGLDEVPQREREREVKDER